MKRIILPLALAALAALTALAAVAATGASGSTSKTTIKLRSTPLGKILTTSSGETLYRFTHDKAKKDTCVKISGCAGTWPPLKAKGKLVAGAGVKKSLLGTITLAHHVKQVTYAGHPLYTYAFSAGPGDTSYVGTPQYHGTWDAVSAKGGLVK